MLSALLHILYVLACLFLILVVLLQTGKRADLAGAFGGGGSQTAFGARGAASVLAKLTTGSAVLFMLLALWLAILSSRGMGSRTVLDTVPDTGSSAPAPAPVEAPLAPSGVAGGEAQPTEDTAAPPSEEPAPETPPPPAEGSPQR